MAMPPDYDQDTRSYFDDFRRVFYVATATAAIVITIAVSTISNSYPTIYVESRSYEEPWYSLDVPPPVLPVFPLVRPTFVPRPAPLAARTTARQAGKTGMPRRVAKV